MRTIGNLVVDKATAITRQVLDDWLAPISEILGEIIPYGMSFEPMPFFLLKYPPIPRGLPPNKILYMQKIRRIAK